jgi:hypothetical protein
MKTQYCNSLSIHNFNCFISPTKGCTQAEGVLKQENISTQEGEATADWRKLCNEKFRFVNATQVIVVIQCRRIKGIGHVTNMADNTKPYSVGWKT